jgi:hypothetical protein
MALITRTSANPSLPEGRRELRILSVCECRQQRLLCDVAKPDNGVTNFLFHGILFICFTKRFRAERVACAYRVAIGERQLILVPGANSVLL